VIITAMEILVDNSGYPTESIARNSHDYRPLGLGYANLGALLMAFGLPYDSAAGRDLAASFTAIMCGQAYLQSAIVAANCRPVASATPLTASADRQGGACPGFYVNREPFLDVIRMHRAEVNEIGKSRLSGEPFSVPQLDALIDASRECWDMALLYGERHGYRNSQTTVLAPTGTIGFMMDCDTTGIEPDLALVKYKKLVGGGMIKIVNNTVPAALFKLGYGDDQVNAIVSYIDATGQGHPLHPLHGTHQDDGRGAAVSLRRHLQDREPAPGSHCGRRSRGLRRELAAGHQGRGHLPRRLQGHSAPEYQHGRQAGALGSGRRGQPRAGPTGRRPAARRS
jgi:ribonucleotide reductase alpha subunit